MKTLHECVHDAQWSDMMYQSGEQYADDSRYRRRIRQRCSQSFILDAELKAELDAICRSNRATASSFLRECCKNLVSEYLGIAIDSKEWIERYGKSEALYVEEEK